MRACPETTVGTKDTWAALGCDAENRMSLPESTVTKQWINEYRLAEKGQVFLPEEFSNCRGILESLLTHHRHEQVMHN